MSKYLSYFTGAKNDIALIRLNESVPLFNEDSTISSITPVCLPWSKDNFARNLKAGSDAVVTGWGRTTNDRKKALRKILRNRVQSKVLQRVTLPIADVNFCKDADQAYGNIDATTQICAGGKKGNFFLQGVPCSCGFLGKRKIREK